MDGEPDAGRASRLTAQAQQQRAVASGLEALADEVERALDGVVDRLLPTTWSSRAADLTRRAAAEARAELSTAAGSLRATADDLRASAALLQWRAEAVAGELRAPVVGHRGR